VRKRSLGTLSIARVITFLAILLILLNSSAFVTAIPVQPEGSLVNFQGVKIVKNGEVSIYSSLSLVIARCNQTIAVNRDNELECQLLLLYMKYDPEKNELRSKFIVLDRGDILNPSKIVLKQLGKEQILSEITLYGMSGEPFNEVELNRAAENMGLEEVLAKIVKPYSTKLLKELKEEIEHAKTSATTAVILTTTKTVTSTPQGITITLPKPEILFSFAMAFLLLAMFLSILLALLAVKSM